MLTMLAEITGGVDSCVQPPPAWIVSAEEPPPLELSMAFQPERFVLYSEHVDRLWTSDTTVTAPMEDGPMPAPSAAGLIDVVDDRNQPIGALPRAEALPRGANFRTVHVLLFNSAGELLIQRLARTRERHALLWGSSVAGYLHAGEEYSDGAGRRLSEELGLLTPVYGIGILRMIDERSTKFVGVFLASSDDAAIQDPEHVAELRYVDPVELATTTDHDGRAFTDTFLHVFDYWRRHTA